MKISVENWPKSDAEKSCGRGWDVRYTMSVTLV